MQRYRRNLLDGGTYFFTVNLLDRSSRLLVEEIALLRAAVKITRARLPFQIDAWVVLPDHMHCLWTLPPNDADYAARWRMLKSCFSRAIPRYPPITPPVSASRASKGERGIWQRRFWEHTIRDDRDYTAHLDYIHFNPVKHGLVTEVAAWAHSSFHRCVASGLYPTVWDGGGAELAEVGERVFEARLR